MCVSFKPFPNRAGKTKFQMKYCKDQSLFNKIAKIPKRHFGQTMQGHRVDHWFYLLKKDESSFLFFGHAITEINYDFRDYSVKQGLFFCFETKTKIRFKKKQKTKFAFNFSNELNNKTKLKIINVRNKILKNINATSQI